MRRCSSVGLAVAPRPLHRVAADRGRLDRVVAGRVHVADARPLGRRRHPALRGRHRDAETVVLAHEQQRQRQPLPLAVAGRVQRAGRRRVVDARVAERADDHRRRRGQRAGTPSRLARLIDSATPSARGRCDAIVEVCGITAERGVAEHLVPAAGRRVVGAGQHAEQHRPQRVVEAATGLHRAGQEERAGAVVQQRRVGRPRRPGRRTRSTRARPIRSCRSPGRSPASAARGCPVPGCRPSRRTR